MTSAAPSPHRVGPSGTTHAERSKMPLSPHLQVWRFTATMAASIVQRITGVANVTGTALLAFWAYSMSQGAEFFAPVAAFLGSPLGKLILFGYTWSLCFHMLGGLRYLYTDTGRGLVPETARRVAWAVFVASFLLALIIAWTAATAASA